MNYNKKVERYYQGNLVSISGDGKNNVLRFSDETVGYFSSLEDAETFFELLSDMFTAFETIGGFKNDGYSE